MWRVWFLGGIAAVMVGAGCGKWADDAACGDQGCFFTKDAWARVQSLANVTGTPPRPDPSNAYLPIVDWRTRALAPGANDDTDGTLIPDPASDPVVNLGWRLYHEPALSGSLSNVDTLGLPAPSSRTATCQQIGISCATCHNPARGGSDLTSVPNTVSIGAGWYDVNSQQTLNAAHYPILYWNGRTDTLWAQAAQVIESGVSMNANRMKVFWVILQPQYWADYSAIFPDNAAAVADLAARITPPMADAQNGGSLVSTTAQYKAQYDGLKAEPNTDQQSVDHLLANVGKAIAAYEWVLSSDGSPFDQYVAGVPAAEAGFSPAAQRGLKLFVGRASCIDCHNTPMLSDGKFHDIGIPQTGPHVPTVAACTTAKCDCVSEGGTGPACLPLGAYSGQEKLAIQTFKRGTAFDDNFVANRDVPPPALPPLDPRWIGAWRTPSLRDVAMTAPYMHDGSLSTLGDVVWHYDQGGGEGDTIGTSELAPLLLAPQDRDDLVAFLQTLTGTPGPAGLVEPPPATALLGVPTTCAPPATAGAEVAP